MLETIDFEIYNKKLKEFIKNSIENYFVDDNPARLGEVLKAAGVHEFYSKIKYYTDNELSQPISYEALQCLSAMDPEERSPLEIRQYLLGNDNQDYSEMSKDQLVDLVIELNNTIKNHDEEE